MPPSDQHSVAAAAAADDDENDPRLQNFEAAGPCYCCQPYSGFVLDDHVLAYEQACVRWGWVVAAAVAMIRAVAEEVLTAG